MSACSRSERALSRLARIDGIWSVTRLKARSVRTSNRVLEVVVTVAVRGAPENKATPPLKLTGAKAADPAAVLDDIGGALDEDNKIAASRTLSREVRPLRGTELVCLCRDRRKLFLRAMREQRHALDQLDLGSPSAGARSRILHAGFYLRPLQATGAEGHAEHAAPMVAVVIPGRRRCASPKLCSAASTDAVCPARRRQHRLPGCRR